MGDIVVKVLTPADDRALIALEDAKIMLGQTSDTTDDQQLQMLIEQNSAQIARMCNREFAKERVRETHGTAAIKLLPSRSRIFLTHWPVKEEDIETVIVDGSATTSFVVEEISGKLTVDGIATEIEVTYTGGYDLPDEAPLDLQQALTVLVRTTRAEAAAAAVTGIRMISHKNARVMFHNPAGTSSRTSTSNIGGTGTVQRAINDLLMRYTRIEA